MDTGQLEQYLLNSDWEGGDRWRDLQYVVSQAMLVAGEIGMEVMAAFFTSQDTEVCADIIQVYFFHGLECFNSKLRD